MAGSRSRDGLRVTIAPLAARDETEFVAAARRSLALHGRWVSAPQTRQGFRSLLARSVDPANACFVVRRGGTGELAGVFNISNMVRGGFQSAYLGYYAFAGHEGQGVMRSGLRLVVRTAFKRLKLHRLEANIQPENAASIALARSCGFKLEGYSPRYLKIGGRWRDHERWAILADG